MSQAQEPAQEAKQVPGEGGAEAAVRGGVRISGQEVDPADGNDGRSRAASARRGGARGGEAAGA